MATISIILDPDYVLTVNGTVLVIVKLTKFPVPLQFRCDYVAVPINNFFVNSLLCFAIFKNVVQRLEPGETPSDSASRQVPNNVQRSKILQNI